MMATQKAGKNAAGVWYAVNVRHMFTHSRLLAFLERVYLKQVVFLKQIYIGIDMDIETLFLVQYSLTYAQ